MCIVLGYVMSTKLQQRHRAPLLSNPPQTHPCHILLLMGGTSKQGSLDGLMSMTLPHLLTVVDPRRGMTGGQAPMDSIQQAV